MDDIVELLEFMRKMGDDAKEAIEHLNFLQLAAASGGKVNNENALHFFNIRHMSALKDTRDMLAQAERNLLKIKLDIKNHEIPRGR